MNPSSPPIVAIPSRPGADFAASLAAAWERGEAVRPYDPRASGPPPARGAASAGTALVIATSGSGGAPKLVELSHDALTAAAIATHNRLDVSVGARWLCCLPLDHISGAAILVRSALLGTDPDMHDSFDVAAMAASRAQLLSLVPTMLFRLVEAEVDLSRFDAILLGGAPIPRALLDRARATGARIVTTYGMTETCGGVVYDGMPLDGVEVEIADDGEILIAGPTLMTGYLGDPDASRVALADGRLRSGDVGRLGPDGTLQVLGRLDDVIITGGEKVAPARVEAALLDHPEVGEAVVVGLDDAEWGQRVVGVVSLAPGHGLEAGAIRASLGEVLARHEVPKEIAILPAIPMLASGKADRAAVKRMLAGEVD